MDGSPGDPDLPAVTRPGLKRFFRNLSGYCPR
jgi:hypothetical protein